MHLATYPIIIIALLVLAVSLVVAANVVFYVILEEVNGRLPEDQRIGAVGVNANYQRVLRTHAQFFPESGKRHRLKLLFVGGFLSGALAFLIDIVHYGHR